MNRLGKFLFSARLAVLAAYPFVPNTSCDFHNLPAIFSISPNPLLRGQQHVMVTITGTSFISPTTGQPPIVVVDEGNNEGISGTRVSYDDEHIVLDLSVSPTAPLGPHSIAVYTHAGVDFSPYFYVACDPPSSCPPLPDLTNFDPIVLYQGETRIIKFEGQNFLNNSPTVEFHPDESGLSIPPGTVINVQRCGNLDTFTVPVVVDSDAHADAHRVRVVTSGGRTTWESLSVRWFGPLPPPAGAVTLDSVTPSGVGPNADVLVECHGKGFGVNRQVVATLDPLPGATPTPIPATTYPVVNSEADPDTVVVAKLHSMETGTAIKVQVKNVDANVTTDDIRIFVNPVQPATPVGVNNTPDGVHRGGTPYTLQITGQNLANVCDASWSALPGLTFSNTNATPTSVSVTVTADATASLTGNKATNLTVTIPGQTSFPFPLQILP